VMGMMRFLALSSQQEPHRASINHPPYRPRLNIASCAARGDPRCTHHPLLS
jgi:hypothetical protein